MIETTTHGRYLVQRPPSTRGPLLVGCHGYAETAEVQLRRLHDVPGLDSWVVVSVQALHRFYHGRSREVGASWMTRQDRELAIADNLRYVAAVVDAVSGWQAPGTPLVFAGFSQGVAMGFRAACASSQPVGGVIALGGDVPPELEPDALRKVRRALVGRGERDDLYPAAQWEADCRRLRAAGVEVTPCVFAGAHEWMPAFSAAAGEFLRDLLR